MDTRYASRKFILSAAAMVAAAVFFSLKMITPNEYLTFTQWALGLYMAGNVGDTAAEKLKA